MKTVTRIAVGATGVALTMGTLALSPATAQNIPAGGIQIWGQVYDPETGTQVPFTASHSGPYKAFAAYGESDGFAIGLDDKLVALPGTRNTLAVPSDPSKPAGDVAGTTVRSVSVKHASAAWAVTADGAVHKWGGARGIVIPDNTWTPSQLGSQAVSVAGEGSSALVQLQSGGAAKIDAFGISPCTDGGQPLSGVKAVTGTAFLLQSGRVVTADATCAVTTVIAASATDPVVDLSDDYATTASGKVLRHLIAGAPEVERFPTSFAGKAIHAVQGDSSNSALLTDQGEVVVWNPSEDIAVTPAFQVPPSVVGRSILSLAPALVGNGFAVLYADVANQAKPTVSGTASVGSELTATEGDWLGEPTSFAYQWLAVTGETETEIAGATQSKFTATAAQLGKKLRVKVTATRGSQVVSATSDPTSTVSENAPALAVTTPASATGTAQVGQTLTGTPAVFNDPAATVTNQWLAGTEAISGATGTSLVLTAAQLGKNITFKSTATRGEETASSTSTPLGPVVAATPVPVASTTTVTAPTATYGSAGTVTVAVSNTAGRPVAGTVTLSGAGAVQAAVVTNGGATFALDKALAAGSYTLTAAYSGSSALNASASNAVFTVSKGKSSKPAFKVNKASTSKKKGKATVTVGTGSGLAKASGKVTVTLKKGKTTKKITVSLSGGKKSISLPKLKKGTWKVQVSYNGDTNYGAQKSKSYNLKIKK